MPVDDVLCVCVCVMVEAHTQEDHFILGEGRWLFRKGRDMGDEI